MEMPTHAAQSGQCNSVTTIPIEFFVYDDATLDTKSATPAQDCWIYVFKKLDWGCKLYAEVHIDEGENVKLVNWHGEHWVGEDDRPATVARDPFEVSHRPDQYDLHFFLSRVQLARKRLETYIGASGLEPLSRRGLLFDPADSDHVEPLGDDCSGCRVYLIDNVQVAQTLHRRYQKAADRYGTYLDDDRRNTRQLLASFTLNVAASIAEDEEDVWDWVDQSALQKEINTHEHQRATLEERVEQWGQALCAWMERASYREMLLDYTGSEAVEDEGHDLQADLSAGLSQSDAGRQYLENRISDRDSWYNKIAIPAGKYLFGEAKRAIGTAEKAVGLLQEIGPTMAATDVKMSASLVRSFFTMRFNQRVTFYKAIQGADGGLNRQPVSFQQFVEGGAITRGIDVDTTTSNLQGVSVNLQRLTAVLNVLNLALVGKSLRDAKDAEKQALAMVDLTAAIGDVAASIAGFMQTTGKTQLVGRTATIVGGVLGYGKSVYQLATRSPDMNNGVITGLSLAALGGAFTAASGVSALTGSLFVGLGATGIGLIAVGLAAAGAGIVFYFKESPLEKWFKQCPWSQNPSSRPPHTQLEDLFKILAGFSVQCDILRTIPSQVTAPGSRTRAEYTLRFRIRPGLYYPRRSVFNVNALTIGGTTIDPFAIDPAMVATAQRKGRARFDDGKSALIVQGSAERSMELSRQWGINGYPSGLASHAYTVVLDVLGDGSYTVEVKGSESKMPVRTPGGVEVDTIP